MAKVIVNKQSGDRSLPTLCNGSIVIIFDRMNAPVRSYLVTSYRGVADIEHNSGYCSLIDLVTGNPAFEEPISRKADSASILHLIYEGHCSFEHIVRPEVEATSLEVLYDPAKVTIKIEYTE